MIIGAAIVFILILSAAVLAVAGLVREWNEDESNRLGKHFLEPDRDEP